MSNKQQINTPRRTSFIKKFLVVVGALVGSFAFLTSAAILVLAYTESMPKPATPTPIDQATSLNASSTPLPEKTIEPMFLPPPRTTIMILGTDKIGGLADVILVATFDAIRNKVDVISIPRDTYIKVPKEEIARLKALKRWLPSDGVMKFNELNSYAGKTYGPIAMKNQLSSILGVTIDYYATVDTAAFRNIVDAVGGIYMDIRKQGYNYEDPEQGLIIHVPGGPNQLLNGKMAEGVVRFRNDYRNGDIDRIAVQQQFMKNFFAQVLNKEAIVNNIPSYFSTFASYVGTDFGLDSVPYYISSVGSLSADSITFHTVKGQPKNVAGREYYVLNQEILLNTINAVFYPETQTEETQTEETQTPLPTSTAISPTN